VWRQSRKETQHVALSLTATILWIKKANKEFFSPFLEIINISNVYMRKVPRRCVRCVRCVR
jgi:hypothetical protein